MRLLFAFLSFLALALSPIAAPAASAAMAAKQFCAMAGMEHHSDRSSIPASGSSEPCCVAVTGDLPVAITVPAAVRVAAVMPVAPTLRVLGGAGPSFDDPPPKS